MSPEDKIEPMGYYRGIRAVREGSVFAKYKLRKKIKKKEQQSEEKTSSKESSEHRIDIEA
ncbi:hypothetical protein TAGGR_1417 [Thermodesulfovibrio aggregans]|uniref:Uncharacterized protein n=1 Tax=Thermodesulfovibrio aggregans TaxID=86166 RepID=A0A0U9HM93_9BACT|nr:hypothetical protein [Thermodesulfovibrio aggregans]GAQ94238.1 hypothetical protein TAGGR_1417 [Thermodesulfovibrio aggregans]